MPARPGKGRQASDWVPGMPANLDAETARLLASYSPSHFQADEIDVLLGHEARAAAEKKLGLELLARARVETVPPDFSASFLLTQIRNWRPEIRDWEIGPEPPAAERDALEAVSNAAARLRLAIKRIEGELDKVGSRLASGTFAAYWGHVRLDRLCHELEDLCLMANSPEVKDSMRREDRPLKKQDGWSAREAFFGHDIPELYKSIFRRAFTASGKQDINPSEGVRFACVIAGEVLGYIVSPGTVVKQRTNYRAARGGKRREN